MADNWELGSNFSQGIGLSGISELSNKIQEIIQKISGPLRREALWAGAEVVKSAIQAATPVAQARGWGKNAHAPGQAKLNVIIYQRKAVTYSKGVFTTALSKEAYSSGTGAENLLIGYEKSKAYYMYFVHTGYTARKKGDIVVRTRAGGKSSSKHFRAEDLYFPERSSSKSLKGGWGKAQFGRAVAQMDATGGRKVDAQPLRINAEAVEQAALAAIEETLRSAFSMVA